MALSWKTYDALPRLRSYAEAFTHWENVVPILRDEKKTKPVGRRSQKWFSIWFRETDKAVCIGYSWTADEGGVLLAYHPDGRVVIAQAPSVSCRERVTRITGINMQRYANTDWVHTTTFQDGQAVNGWWPLAITRNNKRQAIFILRGEGGAVYVNPVPAVTHTKNREGSKAVAARFKDFTDYVNNIAKLTEGALPRLKSKEVSEMVGEQELRVFGYGYHDGDGARAPAREHLMSLATSGDTEKMYHAMVWISAISGYYWHNAEGTTRMETWREKWQEVVNTHFHKEILVRREMRDGRMVRDRYAQFPRRY